MTLYVPAIEIFVKRWKVGHLRVSSASIDPRSCAGQGVASALFGGGWRGSVDGYPG